MLELYRSQWLKSKKEAIINGDNNFQKALDDTLSYQHIETHPERILNFVLISIIGKG